MEQEKVIPSEPVSMEEALNDTYIAGEPRRGELRKGTILSVSDNGLVVDIASKRDGFVPQEDLKELEDPHFEEGDEVYVYVSRLHDNDGNVELSIAQAIRQEDWLRAEQMKEEKSIYETKVIDANRGGLTVEFGHLRGFIPMSQLIGFQRIRQASERQRRLHAMVGQTIMLKVIEVNRRRRRLILSQQEAAKEWRAARRKKLLEDLEPGQVRRGRISQITNFGLFVNLGGLDGLVHVSELSWGRIEKPEEVFHPGQRVKVKVLSVDKAHQRIALSIKALTPDPWEEAPEKYKEGTLVEGKVSQIVDFGIFVELEPGVEGLLHNSELGDPEQREELEPGQSILVKVIRVEPDRRRIGLSARQVRRDEWEQWVVAKAQAEAEAEQAAAAEEAEAAAEEEDQPVADEAVAEAEAVSEEAPTAEPEQPEAEPEAEAEPAAEVETPQEESAEA